MENKSITSKTRIETNEKKETIKTHGIFFEIEMERINNEKTMQITQQIQTQFFKQNTN